ncbi:uncharacterized protein LACBIDRAFT_312752 [Laccaria bicolor S238N-H82]|uniref:Predicted protein n=1 Tax=Laccaria bicolor (strain S238N-H82 / ATCC MYA-4686) TaxID=486041 RepID=B0DWL3_LACBS|nr:uncharacterized protein LACBIDRAFT_312752 [Laccaria bicolor S238N-H82]EDR00956.1 predicted protein [Laccaria bicolor S238N-H82]|eukprot:XP_001888351.1 predicted protein [Laccaria bicolor S238N-H82]
MQWYATLIDKKNLLVNNYLDDMRSSIKVSEDYEIEQDEEMDQDKNVGMEQDENIEMADGTMLYQYFGRPSQSAVTNVTFFGG